MASKALVSCDEYFDRDVIQAPLDRLVLVDVWADWCAPCRALMPVLDKLADEMHDQLTLVKVNADECSQISVRFGIRSLPTVLLFKNGEMIDQFQGALPEQQIRRFLDPYVEHEYDRLIISGQFRLEQQDWKGIDDFRSACHLAPDNARVCSALVSALLDHSEQQPEWLIEAEEYLDGVNLNLERDPMIQKARSRLQLLKQGRHHEDMNALAQKADVNPIGDAAFQYAQALAAKEQYAEALERMMVLMKAPRQELVEVERDKVKESLVALINTCPDVQLANQWRRQLFAVLH